MAVAKVDVKAALAQAPRVMFHLGERRTDLYPVHPDALFPARVGGAGCALDHGGAGRPGGHRADQAAAAPGRSTPREAAGKAAR
jgi:hypothetical protein